MSDNKYIQRVEEASRYILSLYPVQIEWLLVLGSGLASLAEELTDAVTISYDEIPKFPLATVAGHTGKLVIGRWAGRVVAVMQGRFHYYEGKDTQEIVFPIRVMQHLGIKKICLTNAAGGMGKNMQQGELMLITDHIGLWSESPLRGPNLDAFGPRFIDQTQVYDKEYVDIMLKSATKLGMKVHQGVYAWCRGPQFETPAEIKLLQLLGASAVGMSTVPEAIAATHGGMRVVALSLISNLAAGLNPAALTHEEVMAAGALAATNTVKLIHLFLQTAD